jgi:hypothetical protein
VFRCTERETNAETKDGTLILRLDLGLWVKLSRSACKSLLPDLGSDLFKIEALSEIHSRYTAATLSFPDALSASPANARVCMFVCIIILGLAGFASSKSCARRHHAKTEEIRRWCASLSLILKLARRGAARLSRARLMRE